MPPGTYQDTLPYVPRGRRAPSWAKPDPIDELTERLHDFIAAAVHPDEIAALLESDGMSDDRIRERYGVKNSFALAEELYERVERAYPEPEGPVHDPWQLGLLGCLLRGVVFALPGLGYVLGAPLLAGPKDGFGLPAGTVPLLAGALCGWTWNQGLAHRAHSWLGLGDRTAARRSLLVGAPVGMLLGSLVALAAAGTADPGAVAFAAGQSCYLGAATVLLVMGRERALLTALSPMTAGAVLALVHPVPDLARATLLLGSLAAVALLALLEVAPAVRESGNGSWAAGLAALLPYGAFGVPVRPSRTAAPWLAGSLPYALFGLGSGVLVLYAAIGDVLAGAHTTVAAPAAVALTVSMGPAEWLLFRFRSGSLAGLRSSGTAKGFWRTTAIILVRCLTGYLAALLALSLATSALWPHAPATAGGVRLAGLLLLGVVLWTALLLQSFGAVTGAAVVCGVAALAQTVALATHAGSPHWVGPIVYGAAAGVQTGLVCGLLGRATAHR
ncbi:hypothetical protein GCM10011579_074150 [Streptomyces albiflavescens]|uniref:Integral membrane protein n=2 Tax=Streptomyces albiflavescens TaxID=1623582 RepID=A0A917YAT0_9ACTN|nr:hypothetical protein GCM10011579_074150 [Streptomyces albiflavescens]